MKHRAAGTVGFFLVIVLLVSIFVSCAGGRENGKATGDGTDLPGSGGYDDPDNYDSLEARKLVPDDLPGMDFEGSTFVMVAQTMHKDDLLVEEQSSNQVMSAVYSRNRMIEDRYHVSFELIDFPYEDMNAFVQQCSRAGEQAFELLFGQAVANGYLLMDDCLMNWYEIPYINFNKPWWSECNITDLTYEGKAFSVVGAVCLSALYTDQCIFYDKTLAASYELGDLYEIVDAGDWTLDKLEELTKSIYIDVNKSGGRDLEDFYGLVMDPHGDLDAFMWSCGNKIMDMSSGKPELVLRSERIIDLCDRLKEMCYATEGIYTDVNYVGEYGYAEGLGRDMFRNGKCVFCTTTLNSSLQYFADIENYGIIPYPKWNEAQDNYQTLVGGSHDVLSVLRCAVDTEMIGIITEVLCAETWKTVEPVYYDVALKVRGVRDEDAVRMIDLIVDGRMFDFGYLYDMWYGWSFCFERIINDERLSFEVYYAAKSEEVERHYQSIIDKFEEYF